MILKETAITQTATNNTYDEVPYVSHPFAETHPDRLATVGSLFGLRPAPVAGCRFLELGCGMGGNIIPLAMALPKAKFVGIDLSGRQIQMAQTQADALGLKNLDLRHLSILDVDASIGKFDYIVCHGVYSWVPPEVQDRILEICTEQLGQQGIAYVSYNTYPGWHMMSAIRDMMLYHSGRFAEPQMRVSQARALLDFLARWVPEKNNPYGVLLKNESESLRKKNDSYLFHEHLEDVNDPMYFCEFIEQATAKGLQYLADVHVQTMLPNDFPAEVREALKVMAPDIISTEQYMDFLRNRTFRKTLLCHKNVTLTRALGGERVPNYHVASSLKPTAEKPDLAAEGPMEFKNPAGAKLSSPDPLMKAALLCLSEVWPRSIPFQQVRADARAKLSPGAAQDDAAIKRDVVDLGNRLMSCFTKGLVEFHVQPPAFVVKMSERPLASPLARLQAKTGALVTNLRHELSQINEFGRHVLGMLDGKHDRQQIVRELVDLSEQGILNVEHNGAPVAEADKRRALLSKMVDEILPKIARQALLMA